MSLLNSFTHECTLMVENSEADGSGGYTTTWSEGRSFSCYFALDTSLAARRAEQDGVSSVYSALVSKSVPLTYGDYFSDRSTGITYRVTSLPTEKEAPALPGSMIVALKFFTAERKELPT